VKFNCCIAVFFAGTVLAGCDAPPAIDSGAAESESEFSIVNGVKTKRIEGFSRLG